MLIEKKLLSISEFCQAGGFEKKKALRLIHAGRIRAINTNPNPDGRPSWAIPVAEAERFFGCDGEVLPQQKPKQVRQRIDAGVAKVFG